MHPTPDSGCDDRATGPIGIRQPGYQSGFSTLQKLIGGVGSGTDHCKCELSGVSEQPPPHLCAGRALRLLVHLSFGATPPRIKICLLPARPPSETASPLCLAKLANVSSILRTNQMGQVVTRQPSLPNGSCSPGCLTGSVCRGQFTFQYFPLLFVSPTENIDAYAQRLPLFLFPGVIHFPFAHSAVRQSEFGVLASRPS